jgi:hypothetical protein
MELAAKIQAKYRKELKRRTGYGTWKKNLKLT